MTTNTCLSTSAFRTSSLKRCAPFMLAAALLLGPDATGQTQAAEAPSPSAGSALREPLLPQVTGPVIETVVAGFTVQGRHRWERLAVPDLDIVATEEGTQLLPLLRILRMLGTDVTESGTSLAFHPDGVPEVSLDYAAGNATIGPNVRNAAVVVGVSDVTYKPEVYVPADLLGEILALDAEWDPQRYEYTFRSERDLEVFDRGRQSLLSVKRAASGPRFDLPGSLPPAQIDRSFGPRLDFAQLRTRAGMTARDGDDEITGSFSPPRLELWGQVAGGRLAAAVSQKESSPSEGLTIDHASWRTYAGDVGVTLGNDNVGLSELTFPSMNLLGARFNGSFWPGSAGRTTDPSEAGRRERYQGTHVIEGHAPLGSEVTLTVNAQTVDTQIVEDPDGAPPGEGVYRFEGFNLFTSRLNDLRVVVTEPNGTVEEAERQVLGTDLLADAGGVAVIGAVGSRRLSAADGGMSGEGLFAGGRVTYGLARSLTLGATAALQDGLYEEDAVRVTGEAESDTLPARSTHLTTRLVWQPSDPLLVLAEASRSRVDGAAETDWAYRANAELRLGGARLCPSVFRYGPSFFDGQNADLRDVQGGSMSLALRSAGGSEITIGASRSWDDLDGRRAQKTTLTDGVLHVSVRGLIPRSNLSVGTNLVWINEGAPLRYEVMGLDSGLPGGWSLRSRFVLGDDVRDELRDDLPGGSSSRFDRIRGQSGGFGARSSMGSSAVGKRVEFRRRLGPNWQLSCSHRSATDLERTSADLLRGRSAGGSWQWRFSPGYDWLDQTPFAQTQIEYLIGGSLNNRVVLENQVQEGEWLFRLSLQIQLDVGFADNMPVLLGDGRMNPDVGGVKGKVFVDFNGNGLPDHGEPGLENVDIATDAGWKVSSMKRGLFVIPNSSFERVTNVSLRPETLPAIYTPTQATQEAILRSGMLTEVNLGVGAFGSITGYVRARREEGVIEGVGRITVLLLDGEGRISGKSITAGDGSYYIGEVRPGRYVVTVDRERLPEGFQLDAWEAPVEVIPNAEYYEIADMNLTGFFAAPPEDAGGTQEDDEGETEYESFD